ncbi:MAG: hypothetical protein EOO59_03485 [Hymenobacter sp.]|nr:MAG: hypothetical protein EOO59_03485 [Hymenobacter sp.]
MSVFPSNAFSLEYRADLGLVIGRWLMDLPPPALQGTYEAMLAAAQAHNNCRFWLLDLRRRPVAGPDLNEWFRDQFSPRLAAVLGGPLFTAYLPRWSVARAIPFPCSEIGPYRTCATLRVQ